MRPLEERIADIQAKIQRDLDRCQVNEETITKYRALLKQKFTLKDASFYENQFKAKDYSPDIKEV